MTDESLSIEQATEALRADPAPQDPPAEAPEDQIDDTTPPEVDDEDIDPIEDVEIEPDEPAIDPPHSWAAEDREMFAQLPREAQEVILARETQRDRAVSEAQQRAAEASKRVDAEVQGLQQYKQALDEFLPHALQTFAGKWGQNPDFRALADQIGVEAAWKAEKEYETEKAQIQQLKAAQKVAQDKAYQQFLEVEGQRLPELAPDLADPVKGPEIKARLHSFLLENGVSETDIPYAAATHLAMAYDAMRYRELVAMKGRRSPTAPATPTVRPVGRPGRSTQQRSLEQISGRLDKTGDVDDAVRLLQARRTG